MHCSEEQLIACMDDEGEEAVVRCLASCTTCITCIEQYGGLQRDLLQAMFRWRCPPSQTLSDYQLGLLNLAETLRLKQHLTECPHCSFELEELAQFLARI